MSAVAWLALGERGYAAVFLDCGRATEEAAKHHGIVDGLVRESIVRELVQAAFEAGFRASHPSVPGLREDQKRR